MTWGCAQNASSCRWKRITSIGGLVLSQQIPWSPGCCVMHLPIMTANNKFWQNFVKKRLQLIRSVGLIALSWKLVLDSIPSSALTRESYTRQERTSWMKWECSPINFIDWIQAAKISQLCGAGYVREKDIGAFQEAIAAMTGDQHVFKRNLQAIIQRTMKSPQRPVHSAILANWKLFTVSSSSIAKIFPLFKYGCHKYTGHLLCLACTDSLQ